MDFTQFANLAEIKRKNKGDDLIWRKSSFIVKNVIKQ